MKQLQQIAHRSRYKLDKLDPEYQDFEELTGKWLKGHTLDNKTSFRRDKNDTQKST